jgi:3-hydroxyisobutyrate dehydrogenase
MRAGAIAIESSTLTPAHVHHLSSAARQAGNRLVEAPVVGSRPQAAAGSLLYLLGGDTETIDSARSVIDVNASRSIKVGAIGNAATLKLAINGLFAAQVAAFAEVAGFLERSDLHTTDAIEALGELPITSPALARILGLVVDRNYEPNFPIHLVAKDLDYLAQSAAHVGASMPITHATRSVFTDGANGDERRLDIAGIAQRYQRPEP